MNVKCKNRIRFIISIVIFLFILGYQESNAYAGDINEYEQKVIDVVESEFTYEGMKYKADPVYLMMLKEYLANDIDATYEQSQKAIQYIYDNVEQGVINGYIVPVDQEPDSNTAQNTEPTPSPIPEQEQEAATEIPDTQKQEQEADTETPDSQKNEQEAAAETSDSQKKEPESTAETSDIQERESHETDTNNDSMNSDQETIKNTIDPLFTSENSSEDVQSQDKENETGQDDTTQDKNLNSNINNSDTEHSSISPTPEPLAPSAEPEQPTPTKIAELVNVSPVIEPDLTELTELTQNIEKILKIIKISVMIILAGSIILLLIGKKKKKNKKNRWIRSISISLLSVLFVICEFVIALYSGSMIQRRIVPIIAESDIYHEGYGQFLQSQIALLNENQLPLEIITDTISEQKYYIDKLNGVNNTLDGTTNQDDYSKLTKQLTKNIQEYKTETADYNVEEQSKIESIALKITEGYEQSIPIPFLEQFYKFRKSATPNLIAVLSAGGIAILILFLALFRNHSMKHRAMRNIDIAFGISVLGSMLVYLVVQTIVALEDIVYKATGYLKFAKDYTQLVYDAYIAGILFFLAGFVVVWVLAAVKKYHKR